MKGVSRPTYLDKMGNGAKHPNVGDLPHNVKHRTLPDLIQAIDRSMDVQVRSMSVTLPPLGAIIQSTSSHHELLFNRSLFEQPTPFALVD
jgi:hypothetical protein